MADPFPVGSTPGVYATYPGRVVPGSIPARVAPDLEATYHRLAPDPDVFYGTFLPVAFDRPGSARWMREGTNLRWSLPAIVRDGLLGALDLANGTHTGEVTPRAAKLPMDRASIDARAKAMGFLTQPGTDNLLTVYHGTNREISPGFRLDPPERVTTAASADAGIWAQPMVAQRYAEAASQRGGTQSIRSLRARATRVAEIRLDPKVTEMEMKGAIQDAWDAGYDAVRVTNILCQTARRHPTIGSSSIQANSGFRGRASIPRAATAAISSPAAPCRRRSPFPLPRRRSSGRQASVVRRASPSRSPIGAS